jgi:hypothetical protein
MERWRGPDDVNRQAARDWVEEIRASTACLAPRARREFLAKQGFEDDDWAHVDGFFALLADAEVLTSIFDEACELPPQPDFDRFWTVAADRFVTFVDHRALSTLDGREPEDDGEEAATVLGPSVIEVGEHESQLVDSSKTHLHRDQWTLVTALAGRAAERVWLEGWDPDPRDTKRPWRVPLIGTALRSLRAETEWPVQFPSPEIQVVRQGGGRAKAHFLVWTNDLCEKAAIQIGMPSGLSDDTWNQVRSCGKTIRIAMVQEARSAGSEYKPIADLFEAGDARQ